MIFNRIDESPPPRRNDELERWRHHAGYFSKMNAAISAARG
jgi:hypothetical protein